MAPLRTIPLPSTRNLTLAASKVLLLGELNALTLLLPLKSIQNPIYIPSPNVFSPLPYSPHSQSHTGSLSHPSGLFTTCPQPTPVLSLQHRDKPQVGRICSHQKIISENPERQSFATLLLPHIPAMVQDKQDSCHLQSPVQTLSCGVCDSCSSHGCPSFPGPRFWFHTGISTPTNNNFLCPRPQSHISTLAQGGL